MSIYRYAENSAVQEIIFHHTTNRPVVALLVAGSHASANQLSAIRLALTQTGVQSVPVYAEGKQTLQVSGFKTESELTNFLSTHQFTQGAPAILNQPGDDEKITTKDRIKRMSLKLAGIFNMVGTTGLLVGGIRQKDPFIITGGALYTAGEVNLIHYGNAKPEHFVDEVTQDLQKFIYTQSGSEMPPAETGLLTSVDNFLYRNPAQVTLGLSSGGAAAVLSSGVRQISRGGGWGKLGFGLGSIGLKITSMLIPEKSREELQANAPTNPTILQKAIHWIQEKPLRFYGFGSLITDVFLPIDAYQQYRKNPGKKSWMYSAIAGGSYIVADVMYSISSKDHVNSDGKFTADAQRSIEMVAAAAIAAAPEESRSLMAHKYANFLTTRKDMQGSGETISQSILEQAKHLKDNPWTSKVSAEELPALAR